MILSDRDIRAAMDFDGLIIYDWDGELQPTSIDLHLGKTIIDEDGHRWVLETSSDSFKLQPGQFILAATAELIVLPRRLAGILVGKSSLARIGLQIESAGYVDPGWNGQLTLEIKNLTQRQTLTLYAGMKICQIRFEPVLSTPMNLYGDAVLGSHYQGSLGPVPARFDRPDESGPDQRSDGTS
jgi:dCTP deaminase